ncbi:efflux RND transporter periplasmic adaptor subunit [Thermithiobacillus tepidarius DSM 3134]|uniref:efflux RND transporter periplasmic adaptor subunit n=1 Tax=Thermithiobacillus tepidarius TaxID=929 RepID=UPI000402BADB|nr:efflux RND transporter periplasmic adaptor subunit [Thermithiobacillus tepidarius]
MRIQSAHLTPALLFLGALTLTACGKDDKPAGPPKMQPEVGVVRIVPQTVTLSTELPGRTVAYRIAEVRPQVGGILQRRLFHESSEVKAGQPLYQIAPAPFEATLKSAQAALARAEATLASNKLKVERYRQLVDVNAISRQEYDDAQATLRQNEAAISEARAAVQSAKINLGYTRVTAPIGGRIGRSLVTEGALVTADQPTALTTVTQLDPIYVDISQPATELLRLRRELESGQLQRASGSAAKVRLVLEDGSEYAQDGKMEITEVTVDPSTGSVALRAVFPNPDRLLLPGMFVRARLQEGVREQAILAPQQGVTRNPKGEPTALVVGPGNKVEQRVLKTERTVGNMWLVSEGLKPGDQLITEGLQFIHPGDVVRVKPATNVGGPAAPGQAGPAASMARSAQ